ncbi:MAG: c-type cytochrome [Gammaproteobacteria bacterium]|nr:c-type cytochrome [Gammaproteobacteria bacterium]
MSKALSVLFLAAGLSMAAHAAPSSKVAWTVETMALIKSGDGDRGATLTERCASCHGEDGVSRSENWPSLAGQLAPYIYKQLKDYKDGQRRHGVMRALSRGLSDQDMADIAAYYAALPVPEPSEPKGGGEAAERLAKRGDGVRLIPACQSCHGRDGRGNATGGVGIAVMPSLVAQYPTYIAETLRDYKNGKRANDVYSRMRSIAAELSDDEIQALADHYGTLTTE